MRLTFAQRKRLPTSSFVDKTNRKYPIQDASHARNALARVSQFGSPALKSQVRSSVSSKFPSIRMKVAAKKRGKNPVKVG